MQRENLPREKVPRNSTLVIEDGLWKMRWDNRSEPAAHRDAISDTHVASGNYPVWVGPASGPKGLSREEAQQIVWRIIVAEDRAEKVARSSSMTLGEFVEKKFVPEYVASKDFSGRLHYQSMLKHVLRPEDVDKMFGANPRGSKLRLQSVEKWPYLGHVPLREVRPEFVLHLTTAALSSGYSLQTVTHIRNVVSTIFCYAHRERYFNGENPAAATKLPKVNRPSSRPLPAGDLIRLLTSMRYPEKEMTFFAVLTGMSVAEICGLQWKRVNLTDTMVFNSDGESVPSRTLLVREAWMRGQLVPLPKKRIVKIKITKPLLPVLSRLRRNPKSTGSNDFVLTSRSGGPLNPTCILISRLKPIGEKINIPGLSWQMVRRIHKELPTEYGAKFHDHMIGIARKAFPADFKDHENWRSNVDADLPY